MKGPTSSDKRLRLFENRWLELLTVISVRWFMAIWTVVLGALAVAAWGSVSLVAAPALILAGWLLFSALEYALHRFVFHLSPQSDWAARVVFIIHGNHHLEPTDKLRSLMPPIISFPIALGVAALLDAAFGSWSAWMLFGFLLGYVAYDLTHYATHQWPMRGWLGQKLKRHHMLHHFVSENGNYAVTALFWDRVFGTRVSIERRSQSRAAAARDDAFEPAE